MRNLKIGKRKRLWVTIDGVSLNGITRTQVEKNLFTEPAHKHAFDFAVRQIEKGYPKKTMWSGNTQLSGKYVDISMTVLDTSA